MNSIFEISSVRIRNTNGAKNQRAEAVCCLFFGSVPGDGTVRARRGVPLLEGLLGRYGTYGGGWQIYFLRKPIHVVEIRGDTDRQTNRQTDMHTPHTQTCINRCQNVEK